MGYVLMSIPQHKKYGEPALLGYGRGDQPAQDMLLKRGRRATMFATAAEAWRALDNTLKRTRAEKHEWPERYTFDLIEVEQEQQASLRSD